MILLVLSNGTILCFPHHGELQRILDLDLAYNNELQAQTVWRK
jgi:hypothetical protein